MRSAAGAPMAPTLRQMSAANDPNRPRADRDILLGVIRELGYQYREEPFRLSSGGFSHDYVDMRRAFSHGADLALAARTVISELRASGVSYQAIGGMTMGADPIAHAVAVLGDTRWFSVRKAEKDHGSGRRIEGAEVTGRLRVVAFEDTVSTGRSVLEAIDVLTEAGAEVVAACTLLDRGRAAATKFADRRITYVPLFTFEDLGIDPIA